MATKSNSGQSENGNKQEREDRTFECNICFDPAKDAVISLCGHLFCWPCLYRWIETGPSHQKCPVCKAIVNRDKVIPLYGRGSTKQEDPRNKVPPRPAGQRTESDNNGGYHVFGWGGGNVNMSLGIGAFPFAFITSFGFGENRPSASPRGTQQDNVENCLSTIFVYLAVMFMAWLLYA